eukprot:SAG11_NODE_34250_length_273_cov_0.586207_1_plen_85_part_01
MQQAPGAPCRAFCSSSARDSHTDFSATPPCPTRGPQHFLAHFKTPSRGRAKGAPRSSAPGGAPAPLPPGSARATASSRRIETSLV